jgi:branched-chain amino acid transport system substrate-binding protein
MCGIRGRRLQRLVRTGFLGAFVVTLALASTACGGKSASQSTAETGETSPSASATNPSDPSLEPVTIGVVSQEKELIQLPEVGYVARAYEKYANAELGGIDGHPLKVDVCLSGDTPESTQKCVQGFVNDPNVLVTILGSADTPTGRRLATASGMPIFVFFVEPADAQTEGVYSIDAGALGQGLVVGKYLAEDLNATTASLACIDDPFFREICDGTADAIEANNVTVSKKVIVDPAAADYTGPLTSLDPSNVDAIVAVMPGDQCLPLAKAIKQLGVTTPVATIDICLSQSIVDSGLVEGWAAVMNTVVTESDSVGNSDVSEAHRILKTYGEGEAVYTGNVGLMYANFEMLREIFDNIGVANLSRETIDEAIRTFHAELPTYGPVECPGPGKWIGECHASSIMMQIKNGEFVRASEFLDVRDELAQIP